MLKQVQKKDRTQVILENEYLRVVTSSYGARLERLEHKNIVGQWENLLLSFDEDKAWQQEPFCFGATVGPVAGRLAKGRWKNYQCEQNEGENSLHCGSQGYHWTNFPHIMTGCHSGCDYVCYELDDEGKTGLPAMQTKVIYVLAQEHVYLIFKGKTKETSLWNPANHSYFNLSGQHQSVLQHRLYVSTHQHLCCDEQKIPTGCIEETQDFVQKQTIAKIQKQVGRGLDDCYLLDKDSTLALRLEDEESGRCLEARTNRDAVVLFTGKGMTSCQNVNGGPLLSEQGLAIEFQEVPDAANNQLSNVIYPPETEVTKWVDYHFYYEK